MKKSSMNKNIVFVVAVIVFVSLIAFSSYSIFKSSASNEASISAAKFQFTLNNSAELNQNIVLKDTITTNNYSNDLVVPGVNGQFDLTFDLSNVEVSVNFVINFDTTNIPNNLKLYTDSSYTTPVTSINNTFNIGDSTSKTITIYWKWDYLTDAESNANDNLYMNEEILLPVSITVSQIVGGGN